MVRKSGSESNGQKKSCAFFHEKEEVFLNFSQVVTTKSFLTNLIFFQYVNDDLPRGKMDTYVGRFLTICGICLLFGSYIILSVIFRRFFGISLKSNCQN